MVAACRAAVRAATPFVASPRGSLMTWSMSQKRLKKRVYWSVVERRLMDRAAAIHCTSELEQEQLAAFELAAPVFIVPNGIDVRPFNALPLRGTLRSELAIGLDTPLTLFVGRLHVMKRLELTVEAFASVVSRCPEAHLAIVGPDDGARTSLERSVARMRLGERVHVLGLRSGQRLLEAYADADLLVLLSHRENFGMVVAEAMAARLPVLLSSEVGLAAEVKRAEAGVVVGGDASPVAEAWSRLCLDAALRRSMGINGRRLVEQTMAAPVAAARMLRELAARAVAGR